MPKAPARRANPRDAGDIALYRAAYARDGKHVVLRPGADRAAAHAALTRLVKNYLPLALGVRDLHAVTIDDHTVESVLWDALGGVKSFTYDPSRASLAAWLRTTVTNALIDEGRLLTARAHDELDEATPADERDDDAFADIVRAIDAILSGKPDADLLRAVIDERVLQPARRSVPPTKVADLSREHGLTRMQARIVVERAEQIARDAATKIGLRSRTSA